MKQTGASETIIDDGNLAAKLPGKFDKCLELVGVQTMDDSMACLKPGGICCITGIAGGTWMLDNWNPMEHIDVAWVRLLTYD